MLLGDNTGGGAVMLPPIRFQCVGVCVSAGPPCVHRQLATFILHSDLRKIRIAPDFPKQCTLKPSTRASGPTDRPPDRPLGSAPLRTEHAHRNCHTQRNNPSTLAHFCLMIWNKGIRYTAILTVSGIQQYLLYKCLRSYAHKHKLSSTKCPLAVPTVNKF
jgi:hypothetical protein